MGVTYQFNKRYQNFFGYDLRTNDLEFPEQRATDVLNIQYTPTGTIEKRKGYQPNADTGGASFGLFTYSQVDSNGVQTVEALGASNTLKKLSEVSITVTYSGSNAVAQIEIIYDTASSVYRCRVYEGTSTVLDYSLGLGVDEVSPITIANLKTQIDAISGGNFSAAITGTSSTPAAFLKCLPIASLIGTTVTAKARYWSSLNVSAQTGLSGPFAGSVINKDTASFENVTSVQLQNCLYLSNGYNAVIKYDGQNVYRAGLPPASDGSSGSYTITTAGTAGANIYVWRYCFVQKDNKGNLIEGNTIQDSQKSFAQPSVNNVTVTVTNILQNSGFNTNCAIVNGAQSSVNTITVDNGTTGYHTMKVGDTAYFYDSISASYVERVVTGTTLTTITIAGAAVTVADNRVISNNLRIKILRNKNTGVSPVLWYELIEIPNNSFASTQTYTDAASDASLSIQFVEHATDRSPPVSGKYLSVYQNLLVSAGNLSNPNEVSFSDVENCEYFPLVSNQITIQSLQGDLITALHPSNDQFLIFQSRSIHAVTGDVPNQNFRVDVITQDVGCAAHATICDIRGAIAFLSNVGPRVMTGASIPKGLGIAKDSELNSRIDPFFNQRGLSADQTPQLKRAIGFNDRKGEKYYVFIPCESTTSGVKATNEFSTCLVYDYSRDAWVKWNNLDFTAGIISLDSDSEILFCERRDNNPSGVTIVNYVYRFNDSGQFYDYQDHNEAITAYHKSPWEFMGEAGVLKTFERIRVYSSENIDNSFNLTVETEKDFIVDTILSSFILQFGANGYGTSQWDLAPYGDPSTTGIKYKLSNGRCISLRVILKNAEQQANIAITGYELETALPYKPGFKS